ncbi:MAG: hypothetical protein IMF18_01240 [Proteobacteria bacterium]|nr:hypothetical protein [Pseudomonadota bacterium]
MEIRYPSSVEDIPDLIKTKKIRQRNVKDLQDIEYLLKAKKMNEKLGAIGCRGKRPRDSEGVE